MSKQLVKTYNITFIEKQQITDSVWCYFFNKGEFQFKAGQYVQITILHNDPDERGSSRYFTIASSPTEDVFFITTKKGKSSFKKALFALRPGTKIQFFGPMGTFVVAED